VSSTSSNTEDLEVLEKKLCAAGQIVNRHLEVQAKIALANENFSLRNDFFGSKSIYSTYKKLLRNSLCGADPSLIFGPPGESRSALVIDYYVRKKESHHHLVATTVFFFAHTEVILNSCYSLLYESGVKYSKFQLMDWGQKFKLVVGVEYMTLHGKQYAQLVDIRRHYRNIPVHSSPMFLFPVNGIGLVPGSFHQMDDPSLSPTSAFDSSVARDILAVFTKTLRNLERHRSTCLGYYYAKSGLPIHIEESFRVELCKLKARPKEFRAEVQRRTNLETAMSNGEI